MINFISPAPNTAYCDSVPDLIVTLKNFGSNELESVDIVLAVNGVPQSTFSWTGALPYMGKEQVNLGSYPFEDAIGYDLLCYTTSPNGLTDQYMKNDSTRFLNFHIPLSGDYMLGGVNADFTSFAEMNASLANGGVCGPVTIQIADGTYEENISFNAIPGASAENTLTITSASADSSKVVITVVPNQLRSNWYF
ncbi:MAG: hypothetical protein IPJ40_11665 [Saprospirales bacterium]|nr:hypothetical protein [Saprospirales bacterium]